MQPSLNRTECSCEMLQSYKFKLRSLKFTLFFALELGLEQDASLKDSKSKCKKKMTDAAAFLHAKLGQCSRHCLNFNLLTYGTSQPILNRIGLLLVLTKPETTMPI